MVADLICPLYSLCNLAFTAFNFGNFIFPVSKSTAIFPFVKFVVYDLWLSCLLLNFGVLPYRANQSMHMEGDSEKLFSQIGEINYTDFKKALRTTLEYYLKMNS
jgi:hypothetical protein